MLKATAAAAGVRVCVEHPMKDGLCFGLLTFKPVISLFNSGRDPNGAS